MSGKQPFYWGLITLLAEAVLIALLVPSSFLDRINSMEYQWMQATYSESSMEWLNKNVQSWHHTLTRKTGLADGMRFMFLPSEEDKAKQGGMARLGQNVWFPYLESRGRALDEMLKTFLLRIGSIAIWAPLIILMLIPSFFDGVMERRIKQHTFKYPSPFIYRYGVRTTFLVSFLLFIALLSPLPVPPLLLPLSIMIIIGTGCLIVIGNLPKRI